MYTTYFKAVLKLKPEEKMQDDLYHNGAVLYQLSY